MKVLVLGATTPLGLAIVEALVRAPDVAHVLAAGREPAPAHPVPGRVVYLRADLRHARAIRDLVRGADVDRVVFAAHHRRSSDRGDAVHAQNVDAVRALLEACDDHPAIARVVYRSFTDVYTRARGTPELLDETSPLDFDPRAPAWLRDRVEADALAAMHGANGGRVGVTVLRCAELLAADSGSQLHDYLGSRVCLRPLGFDPMINVLSLADAAEAFLAALRAERTGVFDIVGADTQPLSSLIREADRVDVQVPDPLLAPLYALRRATVGFDFRYDLNVRRLHFGGVATGRRARAELGYVPRHASADQAARR